MMVFVEDVEEARATIDENLTRPESRKTPGNKLRW